MANVMASGMSDLAAADASARWWPEAVPSPGRLLRDALHDHGRQLVRLLPLVVRTAQNLAKVARRRRQALLAPPLPMRDAPRTSLNGSVTARREFASTTLALEDIRVVRGAFAVTLNDVLLAVVAGTLRSYLAARGEWPTRPLVAEVPVATDATSARRLAGNRLSNIFTSLCTDIVDPVARLCAIRAMTKAAREFHELLGSDMYEAWTQYAPPGLTAGWTRLYALPSRQPSPPARECHRVWISSVSARSRAQTWYLIRMSWPWGCTQRSRS